MSSEFIVNDMNYVCMNKLQFGTLK